MNSPETQPTLDQEQIRQRREAAARRQQLQLKQQAIKIEQQRRMAARQKKSLASTRSVPLKATVAKVTAKTATERKPRRTVVAAAPVAPSTARARVRAAALPPKPDPVADAPKLDPADMRAELAAFTATSESPMPAEVLVDDLEVVEANPPDAEMPALKMQVGRAEPIAAIHVAEPASRPLDDAQMIDSNSLEPQPPALKMVKTADSSCPKCGALIPSSQRGASYTQCRRCGEILKSNAA